MLSLPFFSLMGLPNFTATSQVNVPVSAVRADYDSTIAAACVHLTLSNVLCYLSGSLFWHHVLPCQLRSSLHHPVSRGAASRALHSSCVRVSFWLEPHSWISQKTAAYRKTGMEGMALSSWRRQWRDRQSCGFSATDATHADWMCSVLAAPSRAQGHSRLGRHLCAISLGKHKMLLQLPVKQALASRRSSR